MNKKYTSLNWKEKLGKKIAIIGRQAFSIPVKGLTKLGEFNIRVSANFRNQFKSEEKLMDIYKDKNEALELDKMALVNEKNLIDADTELTEVENKLMKKIYDRKIKKLDAKILYNKNFLERKSTKHSVFLFPSHALQRRNKIKKLTKLFKDTDFEKVISELKDMSLKELINTEKLYYQNLNNSVMAPMINNQNTVKTNTINSNQNPVNTNAINSNQNPVTSNNSVGNNTDEEMLKNIINNNINTEKLTDEGISKLTEEQEKLTAAYNNYVNATKEIANKYKKKNPLRARQDYLVQAFINSEYDYIADYIYGMDEQKLNDLENIYGPVVGIKKFENKAEVEALNMKRESIKNAFINSQFAYMAQTIDNLTIEQLEELERIYSPVINMRDTQVNHSAQNFTR